MDSSKRKGKAHVPADPESESSSSDSLSKKSDFLDDSNCSESKINKCDKKKKSWKHSKQDSLESLLSNSDSSDNSDYRSNIRKNKKSNRKNDPIKLRTKLKAKLLMAAYKSNIIKFKLGEYSPQRWIYFLTFVDSLDMIVSQYRETCEVLLDYPKIGGENSKYFVKKAIRNLLHDNIDVHIIRLIAGFSGDGIKCVAKLQSHCANITFAGKSRYERIFNKSHIKEGNLQ